MHNNSHMQKELSLRFFLLVSMNRCVCDFNQNKELSAFGMAGYVCYSLTSSEAASTVVFEAEHVSSAPAFT